MYLCISVFCHSFSCSQQLKILNHEIPTRKNFEHTKYPREKFFDPRNIHEKIVRPTIYPRGKILDPRNTHAKNFSTYEILTRKILDSQNTHGKKMDSRDEYEKKIRSHEIHTKPDSTMALDPRDRR